MYTTLLFDLDGTLLSMDMDEFVEHYLKSISRRFAHLLKHGNFVETLMQSTQTMLMNKDPNKTNEQVFMEDFLPRIGLSRNKLITMFTDYYSYDFPNLQRYTRTEPLVKEILELTIEKKFEVVIATNPVFPEIAINQRLQWAGIGHMPFRLVTTYENMHFCKPHLEYYTEILTRLSRLPGECLMIGNDEKEDMAANGVGIHTFLLKNHLIKDTKKTYRADHQGYLEDLYELIRNL